MTPSPCINICQMDDATGWCQGCLRTLDEIAFWSVLDEDDKRAVWAELDRRRGQVGPRTQSGPEAANGPADPARPAAAP